MPERLIACLLGALLVWQFGCQASRLLGMLDRDFADLGATALSGSQARELDDLPHGSQPAWLPCQLDAKRARERFSCSLDRCCGEHASVLATIGYALHVSRPAVRTLAQQVVDLLKS